MSIEFNNERPIYLQIVEEIKMDIISGHYGPGDKLPSVRDLALKFKVNPNTMQKAFVELENNHFVYTERGNGRFVCNDSNLLEESKQQLAYNQTKDFLHFMDNLNISQAEIISYMDEIRKKEDNK